MPSDASQFPSTAWSMIAKLQRGSERGRGLEQLAHGYWRPIRFYLQYALRLTPADSEDMTQTFFAWVVEAPVLEKFDAKQGSFRAFVKGVLRNFVRNHTRDASALKRGGGQPGTSLEVAGQPIPDPRAQSPEEAFDHAWVNQLIDRATDQVRGQLREEGKTTELAIFESYEFPIPGTLPTYDSVAEQLGVSANTVRHQLYRVRERVRRELRAQLRETVWNHDQLEAEWRQLFLGGGSQ